MLRNRRRFCREGQSEYLFRGGEDEGDVCLKESAQLVISGRGGGATEQTERVSEESRWTDERDGATKRKAGGEEGRGECV